MGGSDDTGDAGDGGVALDDSLLPLPGLGDGSSFGSGLPTVPGRTGGGSAPGTEIVSVNVGRSIEDWDVTTLYRVMLLGGIALFAAGQVVVRTTLRPRRRPTDLRQLWRW